MFDQLMPVFGVAVALGADAFSVALGLGITGVTRVLRLRFVLVVAALHVIMPLAGLFIGSAVGGLLGKWATMAGAAVLAFIGILMIRKGFEREKPVKISEARKVLEKENLGRRLDTWPAVLLLGLSVSIDALTVGFSLGTTHVPVAVTVLIMGTVAGMMTALGWISGRYSGGLLGNWAQVCGGVILAVLAVKMLV